MVKISDEGAGEEYGIQDLPRLVYFENGVPEIFEGDIRNDNQIIKWMLDELKQEEIKDVTVAMLNRLIDRNHNLAVIFMDEASKEGKNFHIDFWSYFPPFLFELDETRQFLCVQLN